MGKNQSGIRAMLSKSPVSIAIIALCFLWSIPTMGMLISSFRQPEQINTSGWWTVFTGLENPEYTTLADSVERSETFLANTQNQLAAAEAALENGPTEEDLTDAREDLEDELGDVVSEAESELADAQAALDAEEDGAQDRVDTAEIALADAQAALDDITDEAVEARAIENLEADVERASGRVATAEELLAGDQAEFEESDEPASFPLFSEGWGQQWTTDNYSRVLDASGMGQAFLNSLLVTIPAVVIPITIAAFAAFGFAWIEFPLKGFLFALVIVAMGVPLHLALVPILELYLSLDLGGTYMSIWMAHTGFGLPLAIYLIYGYMITIPRDIIESAKIDGASQLTTFTRLVLPLSFPVIAAFAIFQFLWVWNDLLLALVFLGVESENVVLTAKLTELVGSRGQDWEVLTAGAFLTMILPLIVFFGLQRFFVRGLTAGSVKG